WLTPARAPSAAPAEALAFRGFRLAIRVALWGYRVEAVGGDGAGEPRTRLTEYWEDQRRDHRGAGFVSLLGRLFTGVPADRRAAVNRKGMRAALGRLRAVLQQGRRGER